MVRRMKNQLENDGFITRFKTLYRENAPMLMFYASKYVDIVVAEDVVHDVFLKIWQRKDFLLSEEYIKNYLYRSVRNACLDYLKHQEVEENYVKDTINRLKIEEIHRNDDPAFLYSGDERMKSVRRAMDKLPAKCREVFELSYLEEKKSGEIASLLGVSIRTVEAQLYKALKILRGALLPLILFFMEFISKIFILFVFIL